MSDTIDWNKLSSHGANWATTIPIAQKDNPEEGNISFHVPGFNEDILKLCSNGDILVRGKPIERDYDLVKALRSFVMQSQAPMGTIVPLMKEQYCPRGQKMRQVNTTEIERKFLVNDKQFLEDGGFKTQEIIQGYLCDSTRIRIDSVATITIKSDVGLSRSEFIYEIPFKDAYEMLDELCSDRIVKKKRYFVEHGGHTWDVDVFEDMDLVLAEIELDSEDEKFDVPEWIGEEVTGKREFYNSFISES